MLTAQLDPRLPLVQNFDLTDKTVLVRVDHNVVSKGQINDAFRIDATFGQIYHIAAKGGRVILMSHVGRPRDKKTGHIKTGADTSVEPVVEYLNRKLLADLQIPSLPLDPEWGFQELNPEDLAGLLARLKKRRIGGIYLPNTRWFAGEEAKNGAADRLAQALGQLADLFVNDAFGSWQPHASTYHITKYLPSCAGFLMQKELANLNQVLDPHPPFVAIVAGSKYDTKIGPLNKIYERVDHLILGGVIYNAYLCAKYDITVEGVDPADIDLARTLVEKDKNQGKILELPALVESRGIQERNAAHCRVVRVKDLRPGQKYGYFLDVAPESFDAPQTVEALAQASFIFINAVMGLMPLFFEGTAKMYAQVAQNRNAMKLYGGGDTLTAFKQLLPGLYLSAIDDANYYFFTGGGTVLTAIEAGSPYGLKPVAALLEQGSKQ